MNAPECQSADYIDFPIASAKAFSCLEAAKVQPAAADAAAHDAFTRLLHRLEPDPEELWRESQPLIDKGGGVLVLDDSTLDKHYARKIALVGRHWSGKHHGVVRGVNLLTLPWTDGDRRRPCDYRLCDKGNDGRSNDDHFREMLQIARQGGFTPDCVCPTVGTPARPTSRRCGRRAGAG